MWLPVQVRIRPGRPEAQRGGGGDSYSCCIQETSPTYGPAWGARSGWSWSELGVSMHALSLFVTGSEIKSLCC